MIPTRRIVAAVGLAVSVTGLAAPLANAAAADAPGAGKVNPVTLLDSLARSGIPAEYKDALPPLSAQLGGMNRLHEVQQLHQATDLVAPVTGLLPAVEY
jgi:hypothetical protein